MVVNICSILYQDHAWRLLFDLSERLFAMAPNVTTFSVFPILTVSFRGVVLDIDSGLFRLPSSRKVSFEDKMHE